MKRAREEPPGPPPDGKADLDKYDIGDILGEGSFASVRLVTRKEDGSKFAMKLIEMGKTDAAQVAHERAILTLLGLHRHIVSLVHHFELPDDGTSAFVMELADAGEVFERICEQGAYSEAEAASVVRQVALALAFIHTLGVVHRDLKPENLLLTSTGDVKVADFGLAARYGSGQPALTEVCGTVTYLAPEMLAADAPGAPAYGPPVDLFALGGVMYALLGAHVAFDPNACLSDDEVMGRIANGEWAFEAESWVGVSDAAKGVIRGLLEPDPNKRLSADQVLTRQWVSGEGVSDKPLPPTHNEQLRRFNEGRKVWRAAVDAAAVFAATPLTAAHHARVDDDGGTSSGGPVAEKAAKAAKAAASSSAAASAPSAKHGLKHGKTLLPAAVQAELRAAFTCFDLDGNGVIDLNELRHVLRSLGANEEDAARILAAADRDGDGSVSFDEFAELVRPVYADSGAALRRAFEMFDADSSGSARACSLLPAPCSLHTRMPPPPPPQCSSCVLSMCGRYIDRAELSVMLRKLGFEWQGVHIFDAADTDHDGKVTFDEFLALFKEGRPKARKASGRAKGVL